MISTECILLSYQHKIEKWLSQAIRSQGHSVCDLQTSGVGAPKAALLSGSQAGSGLEGGSGDVQGVVLKEVLTLVFDQVQSCP